MSHDGRGGAEFRLDPLTRRWVAIAAGRQRRPNLPTVDYDGLFERQLPYIFWVHPGVHLHFHVVTPYRAEAAIRFVAAGELGSGVMFNPVTPESAGRLLRAAVSDSGSAIPGPSGCTRLGA